MAGSDIAKRLIAALEKEAESHGIDIVDVEVAGSKSRPRVCVRIDLLDGEGIDMDRVAAETAWVSDVVEDVDPFAGSYDLEVSSPGIERPLRRATDYERFIGERAEIRVVEPVDGKRTITGEICGVEGADISLVVDATPVTVPFDNIKSARLKPDFEEIMARAKKASNADLGE